MRTTVLVQRWTLEVCFGTHITAIRALLGVDRQVLTQSLLRGKSFRANTAAKHACLRVGVDMGQLVRYGLEPFWTVRAWVAEINYLLENFT